MNIRMMRNVLIIMALLAINVTHTQARNNPDGRIVHPTEHSIQDEITPYSTVQNFQIGFAAENSKTTIWIRICADSAQFQMRSENVGKWTSELFTRTDKSNGCSPGSNSWWRMVVGASANTGEVFRIYASATDQAIGEAEFMARAARTDCRVTGLGSGSCTPATLTPVSNPRGDIEQPTSGQAIQGIATILGWAVDAGSINGPGVSDIHVRVNGTFVGAATYGESRSNISGYLGDQRFTGSGFRISFDTSQFPVGTATIQISYRSSVSGNWTDIQRQVTIVSNNIPPNPPNLIRPYNGSYIGTKNIVLELQDTGDPDNGPRNYRDFLYVIERTDGTWSQTSPWTGANWTVSVPAGGTYRWHAKSGDGIAASQWSPWATFNSTLAPPVVPPPPPPPPPGIWNVPYFWQGDLRWGNNKIGACNNNIRNVGCALTSLAMLYQFYGVDKNPGTLNSCLGGQACPLYWGGSRISPCSNGKVKFVKSMGFSYSALEQEVRKRPVILELKKPGTGYTHFIVVLGGSGSNPANYTVNDPGYKNGARTTLSSSLKVFKGYQPSGMRIYTGTPAYREADNGSPDLRPEPVDLVLTESTHITGSIELYSNIETEMILELAAASDISNQIEMHIWTDAQENNIWQPFSQYVSVPLDDIFYVEFRDDQGNLSETFSAALPQATSDIQTDWFNLYLPLAKR